MRKRPCVSMCTCVCVCTGWGYTRHKMDPSGHAFSEQVPVDGGRKGKERWWWGSVVVGRWGPAGMEQPANEEPSEASIHLEHGPLQLPWPWLWSTKMLDPTIPPELPPCHLDGMHAYVYIRARTHRYICMHMYVALNIHTSYHFRPLFSFSNIYHPLFGLYVLLCVFLCVIFLDIIDLYVYVWIRTCTQIVFTTHKSLLFGIISNDEKASGEWYPLTLPFSYMWKCCSFYSFYPHNHALHVSRCLSANKCCFTLTQT